MNAQLESFLNGLDEAVVELSPDGVVRYLNAAARARTCCRTGELLRNPSVINAIEAARHGQLHLPHRLVTHPGESLLREGRAELQLVWSPRSGNVMLLIKPRPESSDALQATRAIGELIDEHCRTPMQRFFTAVELAACALQSRNPADAELQRLVARAVNHGKAVVDKLSQLTAIAEAAAGAPLCQDDRIVLRPMLQTITQRAQGLAEPRNMRVFLEGVESELPALYGAAPWLERAVYEMLACALGCGAAGSDVLVAVTASLGQVTIQVRVLGSVRDLPSRDRSFTSFYGELETDGLYAPSLGIGLSFARWVIERHGGTLTSRDEDNGIAQLCAELPAGAPRQGLPTNPLAQTHQAQQAERYAEDLAQLVSRAHIETLSG